MKSSFHSAVLIMAFRVWRAAPDALKNNGGQPFAVGVGGAGVADRGQDLARGACADIVVWAAKGAAAGHAREAEGRHGWDYGRNGLLCVAGLSS
jgi:hypothetical protein